MKKIALLCILFIQSISLSNTELFDFKNSKKVKVELKEVIQGNTFKEGNVSFKNEFSGSVTIKLAAVYSRKYKSQ